MKTSDEIREQSRLRMRRWREANRETSREQQRRRRAENPARYAGYRRKWREKNPDKVLASVIRQQKVNPQRICAYRVANRAKTLGIDADVSFLVSLPCPELCPALGTLIAFVRGKGVRDSRHTASFDRIDPNRGYVAGNVQIISLMANQMKSNATASELVRFAAWVTRGEIGEQERRKVSPVPVAEPRIDAATRKPLDRRRVA